MLMLNRSPFASTLQNEMNQLFSSVFEGRNFVPEVNRTAPPMNVWEKDNAFHIEAELPGYTMDQLSVTVLGDEVTIKGEREIPNPQGATFLRRERRSGSFVRAWTLPSAIDADRVEASLRDGVLLVTLPKSEKSLPRKIEVKGASK